MDAFRIGAGGALAAIQRFSASAERVASGAADLGSEAVEQVSDKADLRASLAVMKTSDDMFKHLLDIKV